MELRTMQGGLTVSALGLGCMGLARADESEAIATIDAAIDDGVRLLDTADVYTDGRSEERLAKVLQRRRDEVAVATKFGIAGQGGVNGRPEYVTASCDGSLRRLGIDEIDLYYQHRVDPDVPIEETWGAMSELVDAGKVHHLGISEAAPATVRRAHAVHPVAASQNEFSLFTREIEDDLLPVLRELGIALVAYSPMGRGFLTGTIRSPGDLGEKDSRRNFPRFQEEHFAANLALADRVRELADARGCAPSQLALAWVLAQGTDILPIPGSSSRAHLEENLGALEVTLSPEDLATLEDAVPKGAARGDRYPGPQLARVNV